MKLKIFFFVVLVSLGLFFLENVGNSPAPPSPSQKPAVEGQEFEATIWAQVGENYLTLSGYTSPLAKVYLSSSVGNLKRETYADKSGFFLFQFVFLPQKTGELCLLAQDTNGLVSPPLFLPEPPQNQDIIIENILLAPTLSLSQGETLTLSQADAAGKTFPNSKVLVYQYLDSKTTFWTRIQDLIIKGVWAKTAPILEVEADSEGNFEFNLPSNEPSDLKIFVASIFQKPQLPSEKNYSPKSFTLSFKTLSFWDQLGNFLLYLLANFYFWLKKVFEDPTKIIQLEIIILGLLLLKVGLRALTDKITQNEL